MNDYYKDFGPFEEGIWFNSASEGALPHAAVKALQEAIVWKEKPYLLTNRRFREVPARLKNAIGRLLHVNAEDVILGNSATYGIHLLANGISFTKGDEIIVMRNDFPTDILPWLALENQGMRIRQIPSEGPVLEPKEVFEQVTKATKLVCLTHVHTFSGHIIDIKTIGNFCRERGIIFVVNLSQSAGCLPIDLFHLPIDAITTAGFKWLCGPYGTGFCWMTPGLRQRLQYNQAYWVNTMSGQELESTDDLKFSQQRNAAQYDVFGTANFFNFVPLTASIEYLLNISLEKIHRYNAALVDRIIAGLDSNQYDLLSPREFEKRSGLVVFSHKERNRNRSIFETLLSQKIYLAFWKGNLRASPHLYNTPQEIDKFLEILNTP